MSNSQRFFESIDRGRDGKNLGLPIGLPKLELYMDGFLPGTSYLVGANSGVGKSTFVIYSMIYKPLIAFLNGELTNRDPYWIYFNLEMTSDQVYAKLISMYVYEKFGEQLTFKEMFSRGKDCRLTDSHYDLIKQCDDFLSELDKRLIFYEGTLNADKYKTFVLSQLKRFGHFEDTTYIPNNPDQIIAVTVDHMSLIRPTGRSKKEEMDLLSSYSVQLRNKFGISPIHIMQFNRDAGNSERLKQGLQEPSSSDFKDSGAMYEDSHIVIALHAPIKFKLSSYRKYNIKELGQVFVAGILLKSRFGTSDIVDPIGYYGDCAIFKELPKPDQINDYSRYKNPDWTLERDNNDINSHMSFTL